MRDGAGRFTMRMRLIQFLAAMTTRFGRDARGGVAMMFAGGLTVLMLGAGVAVDTAIVGATRADLQAVADEVALTGARQLQLRTTDAAAIRAGLTSAAENRLVQRALAGDVAVDVDLEEGTVTVRVTATPPQFVLAHLGMWADGISAEAVARSVRAENPLCLMALQPGGAHAMTFGTGTTIIAPGCAFQANSNHTRAVAVQNDVTLDAGVVCSAGGIAGSVSGTVRRRTDCPVLEDPLASRATPEPGPCLLSGRSRLVGRHVLHPGTYCGEIDLRPGADVELLPGTYVIRGYLRMQNGSRLVGNDVSLHFLGIGPDHNIVLSVPQGAHVALTAPRTGSQAGLLMTGERPEGGVQRFTIASDSAPELTGTIYLPDGELTIGSGRPIAERSPFTIIVVRKFELRRGPDLEFESDEAALALNTDYHLSDIPVPVGLGLTDGGIRLER